MGEICTDEKIGSKLAYFTLKNKRGYGIEIEQSNCEKPEIATVFGITGNQAEINLLVKNLIAGGLQPGQLTDVIDDYLDGKEAG